MENERPNNHAWKLPPHQWDSPQNPANSNSLSSHFLLCRSLSPFPYFSSTRFSFLPQKPLQSPSCSKNSPASHQFSPPSALAFLPSCSSPPSLFFDKPSPALLFTHQQHGFFHQQHGLLALLLPVQSDFPPAEKGVPPSLFQKEMQITKKNTLSRVPHKRGLQQHK